MHTRIPIFFTLDIQKMCYYIAYYENNIRIHIIIHGKV
jgi:hypothetical protein